MDHTPPGKPASMENLSAAIGVTAEHIRVLAWRHLGRDMRRYSDAVVLSMTFAAAVITLAMCWIAAEIVFISITAFESLILAVRSNVDIGTLAVTVTEPLKTWLNAHATPAVPTSTLWTMWIAAAVTTWLLAVARTNAGRIGWTLLGIATALIVYTTTAGAGKPVAAAITTAWWVLLSLPALRRNKPAPRMIGVVNDNPRPGASFNEQIDESMTSEDIYRRFVRFTNRVKEDQGIRAALVKIIENAGPHGLHTTELQYLLRIEHGARLSLSTIAFMAMPIKRLRFSDDYWTIQPGESA